MIQHLGHRLLHRLERLVPAVQGLLGQDFDSRSIRLRLGEYAGRNTRRNCRWRATFSSTTALR